MAIPLALLTIEIQRVTPVAGDDGIYDAYDPQPAPTVVASGIRAVIGKPSANVVLTGGDRVVFGATFAADPCDIQPGDVVIDSTGTVWTALFSTTIRAFGMDHTRGELRLVQGAT